MARAGHSPAATTSATTRCTTTRCATSRPGPLWTRSRAAPGSCSTPPAAAGRWFRASGTQATTPTIRRAAARAGYDRCISYDVDGLDWQDPSTSTVVRAVLDGARGGSIISLHLGHPVTVAALPEILDGLRARSLQPVTLTELLG